MKTFTFLFLFFILFTHTGFSQKVISDKSENTRLIIETDYKRGLTPNLFVEMTFEDDNNIAISLRCTKNQ
jgi:hypothetical protein